MMHKKIINFSVVIMILLASSWAWSANIDNAPYASTVIKDGAFNINYVGHAGVIVQHIPHAASDDYLIIQETNPNIRLSGYVNFNTFGSDNYIGSFRTQNNNWSNTFRDEVVRQAKRALYKDYVFIHLYQKGTDAPWYYINDIPYADYVPAAFRCDGLVEWSIEQAIYKIYDSSGPHFYDGYYTVNTSVHNPLQIGQFAIGFDGLGIGIAGPYGIPDLGVVPPSSIAVPSSDSDGSYTVSWGSSSTSSVTYVLEEATNSSFSSGLRQVYSGTSISATITGRNSGTTYYYHVKATRSGYTDSDWRNGSNGCTVNAAQTLTVTKAGTGTGTVTSSPSGINCGSTCSYAFAYNASVTLTAAPTSPSTFGGWSGGGCSGTGTCTVTMSAAQSVTATFNSPGNQTLTVTKAGAGTGTVTSSPSGINCGSTCSSAFAYNTSVTLTAAPTSPSTFGGWSGGGCSGTGTCTVTVSTAQSVTATFNTPSNQTLTVTKAGTGTGTVTSSPSGINCGSTCSSAFAYNASVTLTAAPTSPSTFGGWSGGGCSGTGTCTVTMSAAKTVTATFNLPSTSSITVTYPTTGLTLTKGTNYTITWTSSNVTGNVQIELYKGVSNYQQLAASDPNDGSYPFMPLSSFPDGNDYRICVSAMSGSVSNCSGNFTIQPQATPTLTITYPNGGESLTKGTNYMITWTSSNVTRNVQIDLYKGSSNYQQLAANDPNDGSYPFTPLNSFPDGSNYRICISAMSGTVSDCSNSYFTIQSIQEGVLTLATGLSNPTDIAVDDTSVYWAEYGSGTVKKVSKDGGAVTTLASGLYSATSLAVDSSYVYFADDVGINAASIKKVSKSGGSSTTIASGQPSAWKVTVDGANVYWTDGYGGTIRKVPINGGSVSILATGSTSPSGIVVDSTNVYWSEFTNPGAVRKIPIQGGTVTTLANNSNTPGISVDGNNLYWTENVWSNNGKLSQVSVNGGSITNLATGLNSPWDVAADGTNAYIVENSSSGTVMQVSSGGGDIITLASGLAEPVAVAIDGANVYWIERNGGGNGTGTVKKVQKVSNPVNGTCGTSNGQTFTTAPTTNLCSTGAATLVSGSGPWTWSCTGSNGGTTASCSANLQGQSNCSDIYPNPIISLSKIEEYSVGSNQYTRYSLNVNNYTVFPDALFAAAPDLPPCGLNNNSSRTWVEIYNGEDNSYIYGFCGLSSSADMNGIWFSTAKGSPPPKSIYIKLNDRLCNISYTSNLLNIQGDINGDGTVNLADAILAIQIISGIPPAVTVKKEADVNGDNKIGIEEAIYILQFIAGLRLNNYSISGTIHSGSNSGPVLSGATVSIAGLTTTTSSTGTFSITGIPADTYLFSVSKSGYDTYTNPTYYIDSNQTGLSFYLTQQALADQILVGAPSKGGSYYGMYSPYGIAASFTLTGSYNVSTIDVVLRTPNTTNFTTFDFSLQNSLTGSIATLASAALTAPLGSVSTEVMNVNKTLPAGTYYLVGIVPGYAGTPVTPGDVDGWFMSNGVYNNAAGTVTDGVWFSNGSTWTLTPGNYYNYGKFYYTPTFSVNGSPAALP